MRFCLADVLLSGCDGDVEASGMGETGMGAGAGRLVRLCLGEIMLEGGGDLGRSTREDEAEADSKYWTRSETLLADRRERLRLAEGG